MEHKPFVVQLYVPIYGQNIDVLVAEDYPARWAKNFPDSKYKPGVNAQGSVDFYPKTGKAYIGLRPTVTSGTLAHEALHYAAQMLEYVGIPFYSCNHEAYAYLVGWLVEQLEALVRTPNQPEE